MQRADEGDVIGLLLDLTDASLTVYRNRQRLGAMVAPGQADQFGRPLPPLTRWPLRWAVDLYDGAELALRAGPPPPPPASLESFFHWSQ